MIEILFMLASFGAAFALSNKLTFLHGKHPFIDKLLACPFCTGFHTGWLAWVGMALAQDRLPAPTLAGNIAHFAAFCFASSAFCYLADITAARIERK